MRPIHTLVVGTSLEKASDPVVAAAVAIARSTHAAVHAVHAFPMPAIYSGTAMSGGVLVPATPHEQSRCRGALEHQLERVGGELDQLEGVVLEPGPPHLWLHDTAEEVGADLIVVGAHEGSALSAVLGSTTDRVLRKATCPVLVVRPDFGLPLQRVLAPVDLSPLSEDCLGRGLDWLRTIQPGMDFDTETLFVLSRVDREGSVNFTQEQVDRFAEEELERFSERVAKDHLERGNAPTPRLRVGMARQEILAHLDEHPADLVILGTHGRSGFERFMLGSIAEGVVRRSPTSVLVVPPSTEARHAHPAP